MTNYQIDEREWWVQRWLELLDSYRFKKRLERARTYAREGNVLSIDFEGAQVLAKVQGSEAEPYQVSLAIAPFTDEDWRYLIETMSERAIYSAQLLAGEMPANIEEVFIANGLSLFPYTLSDIRARCTCPDKANPCKHIGAVYYQLGDRFSEDPFVLFQLRGRTKAQILEALRQVRPSAGEAPHQADRPASAPESTATPVAVETPPWKQFWDYHEPLESSLVVIAPPPESKTPLDILGPMPLAATDAQAVRQFLQQAYSTASQQAIITAMSNEQ
ncbi:MAG: SWIM zinc finger family protein [Cyanophyceae cyanobacterium]